MSSWRISLLDVGLGLCARLLEGSAEPMVGGLITFSQKYLSKEKPPEQPITKSETKNNQ